MNTVQLDVIQNFQGFRTSLAMFELSCDSWTFERDFAEGGFTYSPLCNPDYAHPTIEFSSCDSSVCGDDIVDTPEYSDVDDDDLGFEATRSVTSIDCSNSEDDITDVADLSFDSGCYLMPEVINDSHNKITDNYSDIFLTCESTFDYDGWDAFSLETEEAIERLAAIEDVDIGDSIFNFIHEATMKFILIRVTDTKVSSVYKLVIRSNYFAEYHSDLFEAFCRKYEGFSCQCVGGGKIKHDVNIKQTFVFGYSMKYGKADHSKVVEILKTEYHDFDIDFSDDDCY